MSQESGITRRRFVQSAIGGLSVGLLSPARGARPDKLNVLLITVDDLCNRLGCYGHPVVQSPNIDALAARGMRFDRAYCQFPVCNPSRTSFLTGLRPDATGILDNNLAFRTRLPDVVTLPQRFRQAGYFTARVGKIFHNREKDDPHAWDVADDPRGTPQGRKGDGRNLTGGKVRWCSWRAAEGTDEDQPDGQVASTAVDLMEQHKDEPFFLAVGFHKPHDPFVAPKRYFDLYPLEEVPLPEESSDPSDAHPFIIGSSWKAAFDRFTDRERREFTRAYYAGASFVDAQIGKVLSALDRHGLADRTVVVLLGDHGYQLGQHGWWNKNALFEPSARAPLVMAGPQIKSRAACSRIVEFLDIYPTLATLCGLPLPAHLQGRSLTPLLKDPAAPWHDVAYTQVRRGTLDGYSVRTDRWRYTEWIERKTKRILARELYDHHQDSQENTNLAGRPEHDETIRRLHLLLQSG